MFFCCHPYDKVSQPGKGEKKRRLEIEVHFKEHDRLAIASSLRSITIIWCKLKHCARLDDMRCVVMSQCLRKEASVSSITTSWQKILICSWHTSDATEDNDTHTHTHTSTQHSFGGMIALLTCHCKCPHERTLVDAFVVRRLQPQKWSQFFIGVKGTTKAEPLTLD